MVSNDEVTNWLQGLWSFVTAPLFVLVANLLILSQHDACEQKYHPIAFNAEPVPGLESDWVCNQALNGIDNTQLTVIGVVIGVLGFLVALLIISSRNGKVRANAAADGQK